MRSRVLVRGDTGSGVKESLWHIHRLGLTYSVGVYGRQPVLDALTALPRIDELTREALAIEIDRAINVDGGVDVLDHLAPTHKRRIMCVSTTVRSLWPTP